MNTPMNLKEFSQLSDSLGDNIMEISNDERAQAFVTSVQDAGINVLSPLVENDATYIKAAVALVQAGVIAELIQRAESPEEMFRIVGLVQSRKFFEMMTLAFKYSVGLAVVEELR